MQQEIQDIETWAKAENIPFTSPEAKADYLERARRIHDAVALNPTDRVPFWILDGGSFPVKHGGTDMKTAMHDTQACAEACKKAFLDLKPDMFVNPFTVMRGSAQTLEALDTKNIKWPGKQLPDDSFYQYVEEEYMKGDEYDLFNNDLSDFVIRSFLPRNYGALAPLANLPPLSALIFGMPAIVGMLALPPFRAALNALQEASTEAAKWHGSGAHFEAEMQAAGFPSLIGSASFAPFDLISDLMRGMRGAMLDMYRYPEKVLEATERVFPMLLGTAVAGARVTGNPGVFIPLHKGADGFMDEKQFETFYWPGLKKLLLALIDNGLTPVPFFEGNYTSRLKYLTELPKGKILGIFESTDIYKAKEIIGDTMCMTGFMPVSLLQYGTDQEIVEVTQRLIDVLGKGGGFIMGPQGSLDDADPAKVKLWAKKSRELGRCN